MSFAHTIARTTIPTIIAALTLGVAASASAATLTEGFDTMTPAGWTVVNNSVPLGTNNWFQGNPAVFSSQAGAANAYAGANFHSGAGVADLSDWLITPTMSFNNGDVLSFYTRTVDAPAFPDGLEVRFSNVGGTNVGSGAASVGTFGQLLVAVNSDLMVDGYPSEWTQYSYTFTGLAGATNGAIGFRYFVPNGGPLGDNSDYIGLDTVSITGAVPEPSTWMMLAVGLGGLGALRARAKRS